MLDIIYWDYVFPHFVHFLTHPCHLDREPAHVLCNQGVCIFMCTSVSVGAHTNMCWTLIFAHFVINVLQHAVGNVLPFKAKSRIQEPCFTFYNFVPKTFLKNLGHKHYSGLLSHFAIDLVCKNITLSPQKIWRQTWGPKSKPLDPIKMLPTTPFAKVSEHIEQAVSTTLCVTLVLIKAKPQRTAM